MKYLFIIAAFNSLFFTVLLFQKKPRALHDNILTGWLIYLGSYIGVYAFYQHDLFVHFRLLSISLISLLLLFGPFLYLYISVLVSGKRALSYRDLIHLLPFLLFNGYLLIASFRPTLAEKLNIEKTSIEFHPPLLFLVFLIITALSGTFYFLLTIRLFKKLDINIFNNFSNLADIDLFWIRKLILVFGVTWTLLIAVTLIHHVFGLFSMIFCTNGLFLSLSAFVILIGYFGLKQKIIYSGENAALSTGNNKPRYSGSRLSAQESRELGQKLNNHLKSSKSYLNPDLTLSHLAAETSMSSHVLSQVINEQYHLNFFDYINQFRVEEFKQKMMRPEASSFSILGIALDCGFNSKSAFNRTFKKMTGTTPSRFIAAEVKLP